MEKRLIAAFILINFYFFNFPSFAHAENLDTASCDKFSIGDRVQVTADGIGLKVRDCASISCNELCTSGLNCGSTGEVVGGCQVADDFAWWEIRWDSSNCKGITGWSAEASQSGEAWLEKIPLSPISIKAPWTYGQTWEAGNNGSFYCEDKHIGNLKYAVDFNKLGGAWADYQEPILASAAGTVTFAGWNSSGYGNLVKIDHGGGIETRYAHLDSFSISDNCFVSQGQEIGKCGKTGTSSPHLHFELRQDETSIPPDPMDGMEMYDGAIITSSNSITLQADLNGDGIVNSIDWSIMNQYWGTSNPVADLNCDGIVNTIDWSIMNMNWGKSE